MKPTDERYYTSSSAVIWLYLKHPFEVQTILCEGYRYSNMSFEVQTILCEGYTEEFVQVVWGAVNSLWGVQVYWGIQTCRLRCKNDVVRGTGIMRHSFMSFEVQTFFVRGTGILRHSFMSFEVQKFVVRGTGILRHSFMSFEVSPSCRLSKQNEYNDVCYNRFHMNLWLQLYN